MSDLRNWLHKNNLEQYADAFEANDVDLDILPDLNEHDLEQLGVSLGNRRRLLRAIAERGSEAMPSTATDLEPSPGAERRQVTVLFCDMVGSTALSGEVDPVVLGNLIRRYQDVAAGAIGRFGGFVAKLIGDGVLAYFGFPHAFEDAAQVRFAPQWTSSPKSAASSGRMARAFKRASASPRGWLWSARLSAQVAPGNVAIVGETPNLAARLQALAAPDIILVSETTQNLVRGLFELEPTGDHNLKGFARPMPVWRCWRGSGCDALRSDPHRRDNAARWPRSRNGTDTRPLASARGGEGQIVTLIGEAGIGKSRSVEALQEAIAGEPHGCIYLQCSPHHSDSALYPVTQHISRTAGFATSDLPQVRIEKLSALFSRRAASDASAIPLLAELLLIPDAPPAPTSLSPAQRKSRNDSAPRR